MANYGQDARFSKRTRGGNHTPVGLATISNKTQIAAPIVLLTEEDTIGAVCVPDVVAAEGCAEVADVEAEAEVEDTGTPVRVPKKRKREEENDARS